MVYYCIMHAHLKSKLITFLLLLFSLGLYSQSSDTTTVKHAVDTIQFVDPTGSYHFGPFTPENADAPLGNQGDIKVQYLGKNRILICLNYVSYGPAFNLGIFSDTLYYDDNWAEYHCPYTYSACVVRFAFTSEGVSVKQHQESPSFCCTFGNNVHVDGFYTKESSEIPFISTDCIDQ
jgi:hypothetical protein